MTYPVLPVRLLPGACFLISLWAAASHHLRSKGVGSFGVGHALALLSNYNFQPFLQLVSLHLGIRTITQPNAHFDGLDVSSIPNPQEALAAPLDGFRRRFRC